jgi:hypothetical protein
MAIKSISVSRIIPNQWNPNKMNEKTLTALKQSIEEFGFDLDPLLVRKVDNKFEIIDGEHRYNLAVEKKVNAVDCVVIDCTNTQAKRLTQIMNRTKGEDDPTLLNELFKSLEQELNIEEIIKGMPLETEDYTELVKHVERQSKVYFDVEKELPFTPDYEDTEETQSKHKSFFVGIPMNESEYEEWTAIKTKLKVSNDKKAFWKLLEKCND